MAKLNKSRTVSKEFILEFCESKMNDYTSQIFRAFYDSDWVTLEEVSMQYEDDCYRIGAIEIVGKLIKLRLQVQERPLNTFVVERTLNGILENSSKVQKVLINHLEEEDCHVVSSRLHYVSKPVNNSELGRRNWVYHNCLIQ